jgi:RNA polymerase sigma-70 factor (ECF subfamily)
MSGEGLTPDEIDELARRARDGEREALEALLAAVRPRALNVCRGVLPYTPDAEVPAHLESPDPRTTSVIAGTRLDLLEAMEVIERDHPQFAEPLLLRDVYGLSYEEIAQQVGAPLGTVKAQIHHGRKLARPLLRGNP